MTQAQIGNEVQGDFEGNEEQAPEESIAHPLTPNDAEEQTRFQALLQGIEADASRNEGARQAELRVATERGDDIDALTRAHGRQRQLEAIVARQAAESTAKDSTLRRLIAQQIDQAIKESARSSGIDEKVLRREFAKTKGGPADLEQVVNRLKVERIEKASRPKERYDSPKPSPRRRNLDEMSTNELISEGLRDAFAPHRG